MIDPNGVSLKSKLDYHCPQYMNFNDIPIFMQWKNAFPLSLWSHDVKSWITFPSLCNRQMSSTYVLLFWTFSQYWYVLLNEIFQWLVVKRIEAKEKWNTNKDLWLKMHGVHFEYRKKYKGIIDSMDYSLPFGKIKR